MQAWSMNPTSVAIISVTFGLSFFMCKMVMISTRNRIFKWNVFSLGIATKDKE